jgi:ICE2
MVLLTVLERFTATEEAGSFIHTWILRPWDWTLTKSTPAFTLMEGFCSLLVVQAVGQICRWVVNNRSDTWMVQTPFQTRFFCGWWLMGRSGFWCRVR